MLSLLSLTEKLAHSHVTIGAIDCGDTWMYSDGEMGPDASDTGRLSLDLPMVENCEMVMLSRFIALPSR